MARSIAYRETEENRLAENDLVAAQELVRGNAELSAEIDCEAAIFELECGRHAAARERLERALPIAQQCGARHLEGRIHRFLARTLAEAFLDPGAFTHHAQATALLEEEGDFCESTLARKTWCVHRIFFQRGDAGSELEAEIQRARDFNERLNEAKGLIVLGMFHQERGRFAEARRCYEQARSLGLRSGSPHVQAFAHLRLANTLDEEGEIDAALLLYARATEVSRRIRDARIAGLCQLYQSGAAARLGSVEDAVALLDSAQTTFAVTGRTGFEELCDLQRAQIERAWARRADAAGRYQDAAALRRKAQTWIEASKAPTGGLAGEPVRLPIAHTSPEARLLLRLLGDTPGLTLWRDGSAFQIGTSPPVELPRSSVLRRVLALLTHQRELYPGESVARYEVLRECWPGERMQSEAGARRVRQVMLRLRRYGLQHILLSSSDGYCLDPSVAADFAAAESERTGQGSNAM